MNQVSKQHLAFVKENHHLSRECVTVFTQIASNENIQLVLEFVFKGNGKRPPNSCHLQEHTINGQTKIHTV